MFSSKLFTRKEVVRGLKNPSPALAPSKNPGSPDFSLQEFERWIWKQASPCHSSVWRVLPGGRRSARRLGIPLLTDVPSGHVCYYCKLSLSPLEGCRTAVALGVMASGQVVETNLALIVVAAWSCPWALVRSSLVAPQPKSWGPRASAALSVPLGQGKRSQNYFYSLALPLSAAALGAYRFWIALALDCCSSPKAPERKSSKPKTPVGVFKGFWVWDNDPELIRWQGRCKDTGLSQNPVNHPPLCTWIGCAWDGEGAPKRMMWSLLWREMQSKQKPHCLLCTLTVLLSHMDFALITELRKICFQPAFFVS